MPAPSLLPDPDALLVPYAATVDAAWQPLLAGLRLPRLAELLARLEPETIDLDTEDSLSPPHERALARALGLWPAGASDLDGRIPWAAWLAHRAGIDTGGQPCALILPCRWQVGMNEVVLDPVAPLALGDDGDVLLASMQPYFEEDGLRLVALPADLAAEPWGTPVTAWLAWGAPLGDLRTGSPDRATGRHVDLWNLPGDAARLARRLQHEMQMLLYTHPRNEAREPRGQIAPNSLWFWGTGPLPWAPASADAPTDTPPPALRPTAVDSLRQAALRQDGTGWLQAWEQLDAGPVAALLARAQAGHAVNLTLCGERGAQTWRVPTRTGWRARWSRLMSARRADPVTVLRTL
jgi:hypothetical protein